MRSPGRASRRSGMISCGLGAAAAAVAGGLAIVSIVAWGPGEPGAVLVGAGLTLVVVAFGIGTMWMLYDIREQQRRIIEQLEIQSRALHNAASVVLELTDEPQEEPQ